MNEEVAEISKKLGIHDLDNPNALEFLKTVTRTVAGSKSTLAVEEIIPADARHALKSSENIFGRYVIIEKVGEGAMGSVFKAFDAELSRYVALKFIKSERAEELKTEAKTLAAIEHKNIARIYDIGSVSGKGYIAMQYIKGKMLSSLVGLDPIKIVDLISSVCSAVDFAHRCGIVHRDIKPDNVILGDDGNIYVMDFGLATSGAVKGEIAGTPGFIAPEIVRGVEANATTDVYSIGSTLYYLLSGRTPIIPESSEDIQSFLFRIGSGNHAPLKALLPRIDAELEAIVEKSIAGISNRYSSAKELGSDLDNYRRGLPVSAFGSGLFYIMRKAIDRNRILSSVIVLSMLTLAALGVYAWNSNEESSRAEERNQLAQRERESAIATSKQKEDEVMDLLRGTIRNALTRIFQTRRSKDVNGEQLKFVYDTMNEFCEEAYGRSQKIASRYAEPHFLMGKLRRAQFDYSHAKKFQETALEKDPNYLPAIYEYLVLLSREYSNEFAATRIKLRREKAGKIIETQGRFEAEHYAQAAVVTDLEVEEANPSLPKMEKLIASLADKLEISAQSTDNPFKNYPFMSKGSTDSARGIVLVCIGQKPEGIKLLKRALERDNYMEEVFELLAKSVDDLDEQIEWYSAGIAYQFGAYQFWLGRANLLIWKEHYNRQAGKGDSRLLDQAEGDIRQAMMLNPQCADAWNRMGSVLVQRAFEKSTDGSDLRDDLKRAIPYFEKAASLVPGDTEAWTSMGEIHYKIGNYMLSHGETPLEEFSKAEAAYDQAVKIDPADVNGWIGKGDVLWGVGGFLMATGRDPSDALKKSEEFLTRSLNLSPRNASAWLSRGYARNAMGLYLRISGKNPLEYYNRAEEDFNQKIKLDGRSAAGWMNRGLVRTNRGVYLNAVDKDPTPDYENAVSDFSKALEFNPSYRSALVWRAATRHNMGLYTNGDPAPLYDLAEADYASALSINSDDWEVYMRRGNMRNNRAKYLLGLGKAAGDFFNLAEADLEKACSINSRNVEALESLLDFHLQSADREAQNAGSHAKHVQRALETAAILLKIDPKNRNYLLKSGKSQLKFARIQQKSGDGTAEAYASGLESLKAALTLDQNFVKAWEEIDAAVVEMHAAPGNQELPQTLVTLYDEIIGLTPAEEFSSVYRLRVVVNIGGIRLNRKMSSAKYFKLAIDDASKVMNAFPENLDARGLRAHASSALALDEELDDNDRLNLLKSADEDIDIVLKAHPNSAGTYLTKGQIQNGLSICYFRMKEYDKQYASLKKAKAALERCVELDPTLRPMVEPVLNNVANVTKNLEKLLGKDKDY